MTLTANNISFDVLGKKLLRDITLTCEPGTVLGIVGKNGAGKSTLLNALSGLSKVSAGTVSINGKSIQKETPKSLASIRAVLPQNSDLSFPLTAIEVVRLALSLASYPLAKQSQLLEECLHRFNVFELAHRNYLNLSGGEKQRVQLARVTAQLLCHQNNTPKYLLLDEPISALDLFQQYQTLDNIRQLAKSGIGVIAILHDLNLASLYCDQIAILNNGELLEHGTPLEVINRDTIQRAFNINVRVQQHPDTHTPFLTPVIPSNPQPTAAPISPL